MYLVAVLDFNSKSPFSAYPCMDLDTALSHREALCRNCDTDEVNEYTIKRGYRRGDRVYVTDYVTILEIHENIEKIIDIQKRTESRLQHNKKMKSYDIARL